MRYGLAPMPHLGDVMALPKPLPTPLTGVEVNTGLLVESPSAAGSYEGMLRRDADLIADSLRARR